MLCGFRNLSHTRQTYGTYSPALLILKSPSKALLICSFTSSTLAAHLIAFDMMSISNNNINIISNSNQSTIISMNKEQLCLVGGLWNKEQLRGKSDFVKRATLLEEQLCQKSNFVSCLSAWNCDTRAHGLRKPSWETWSCIFSQTWSCIFSHLSTSEHADRRQHTAATFSRLEEYPNLKSGTHKLGLSLVTLHAKKLYLFADLKQYL